MNRSSGSISYPGHELQGHLVSLLPFYAGHHVSLVFGMLLRCCWPGQGGRMLARTWASLPLAEGRIPYSSFPGFLSPSDLELVVDHLIRLALHEEDSQSRLGVG